MNPDSWTPPYWMYREERPPNDDAVFEILTRIIFEGGLNWKIIENKWPAFQEAFENFSVEKVASFGDEELANLLENKAIIRNAKKIEATIHNAIMFQEIAKESGSFFKYLDSLDKSNNYSKVIKEFNKRFNRVGPKTAYIFLYSIGEDIKRETKFG